MYESLKSIKEMYEAQKFHEIKVHLALLRRDSYYEHLDGFKEIQNNDIFYQIVKNPPDLETLKIVFDILINLSSYDNDNIKYFIDLVKNNIFNELFELIIKNNDIEIDEKIYMLLGNASKTNSEMRNLIINSFPFKIVIEKKILGKDLFLFLCDIIDLDINESILQPCITEIFKRIKDENINMKYFFYFISCYHRCIRDPYNFFSNFGFYDYIINLLPKLDNNKIIEYFTFILYTVCTNIYSILIPNINHIINLLQNKNQKIIINCICILYSLISNKKLNFIDDNFFFSLIIKSLILMKESTIIIKEKYANLIMLLLNITNTDNIQILLDKYYLENFFIDTFNIENPALRMNILNTIHDIQLKEDSRYDGYNIIDKFILETNAIINELLQNSSNQKLVEVLQMFLTFSELRKR